MSSTHIFISYTNPDVFNTHVYVVLNWNLAMLKCFGLLNKVFTEQSGVGLGPTTWCWPWQILQSQHYFGVFT